MADSSPSRPILAVDVDGVISLFGFEEAPDPSVARFLMIDGRMHCVLVAAGERLRRLADVYDLVWATGWEGRANYFTNLFGMPELPYLSFGRSARFGSAHWKLRPLRKFARKRPLAWIDDSFDESCYEWARERDEPTLLVPTESQLGLDEVHVEALIAWGTDVGASERRG